MSTIDHSDGSSTSIDQEPDGSWTVVTTDANGTAGGAQSFGAGYTAQELTERYTYSSDVVSSSSVEHDDGSSTVYDQLASGGWSVYTVDANGDKGSSIEYGSSYTLEDLKEDTRDAGTQQADPTTTQTDPPPIQDDQATGQPDKAPIQPSPADTAPLQPDPAPVQPDPQVADPAPTPETAVSNPESEPPAEQDDRSSEGRPDGGDDGGEAGSEGGEGDGGKGDEGGGG